jgi:predicted Ser/Thr protein kinase
VSPADITADLSPTPDAASADRHAADRRQATQEARLTEGASFGAYRLLGELGRGGMGVVYLAEQTELHRRCALKTLRADLHGTTSAERFIAEGRAAARLGSHPHLVQVFDAGEVRDVAYIAMEYIEGDPLSAIVERDGPLPERDVLEIGRKLADALGHAHARGIVHRDVKPQNVIIDADGEPHLVDFGLARDLERELRISQTGAVVGTPAYMPPEQADPRRGATGPRSDLYALGATLYHTASGRDPFDAGTVAATLVQVLETEPPPLHRVSSASSELSAIVDKAMAKASAERYRDAAAMADDITRTLDGRSPRAQPRTVLRRLLRSAARHRGALALVILLVTIIVAAAAALRLRETEVRDLRARLDAASAHDAAARAEAWLEPAAPFAVELVRDLHAGRLPVTDPRRLATRLHDRLRYRRGVDAVLWVDVSGRIAGAWRQADGWLVACRAAPAAATSAGGDAELVWRYALELTSPDQSERRTRTGQVRAGDPRRSPWFEHAVSNRGALWVQDTLSLPGVGGPSLGVVSPVLRGWGVQGALSVWVRRAALGDALAQVDADEGAQLLLMTPGGEVVASARGDGGQGDDATAAPALAAALLQAVPTSDELPAGETRKVPLHVAGSTRPSALEAFELVGGLRLLAASVLDSRQPGGAGLAGLRWTLRCGIAAVAAALVLPWALGVARRRRLRHRLEAGGGCALIRSR